jgi:uncharacterized protein with PIN domain
MIVHICFGTRDLEKAGKFYDAIAAALGAARTNQTETAIYYAKPGSGIGFAVTLPYNGEPATFSRLLKEGDRVAVYPAFARLDLPPLAPLDAPPPGRPRFIADSHLGGLARMLRMAGFDTAFRNEYDDREIAECAERELRIVLTRDLELLKLRMIRHGAYVHALKAEAQFAEVVRRFDLLPHFAPFSRCLLCNVPLHDVDKEAVIDQLPPSVRAHQQRFRRCPSCQRIYWPGSHWERMQAMLSAAAR